MGDGYAVAPEEGLVYAPISGVISSVFPTKHAIGITSVAGLEVLVHMGLDTVEMDGEPFETKIAAGMKFRRVMFCRKSILPRLKPQIVTRLWWLCLQIWIR